MAGVVREEVVNALDDAEARGQKKVRVIIGLRGPDSLDPVKDALARLGVVEYHRESDRFLALELSRAQILRVSKLTEQVSRIWLDRPVSAANG